eukprot:g656.t1
MPRRKGTKKSNQIRTTRMTRSRAAAVEDDESATKTETSSGGKRKQSEITTECSTNEDATAAAPASKEKETENEIEETKTKASDKNNDKKETPSVGDAQKDEVKPKAPKRARTLKSKEEIATENTTEGAQKSTPSATSVYSTSKHDEKDPGIDAAPSTDTAASKKSEEKETGGGEERVASTTLVGSIPDNHNRAMMMMMSQGYNQSQQLNGMRWKCVMCGFNNSARNTKCGGAGPLGCNAPRPRPGAPVNHGYGMGGYAQQQQQQWAMGNMGNVSSNGPWQCVTCGFRNSPRNTQCGGSGPLGCNTPRPSTTMPAPLNMAAAMAAAQNYWTNQPRHMMQNAYGANAAAMYNYPGANAAAMWAMYNMQQQQQQQQYMNGNAAGSGATGDSVSGAGYPYTSTSRDPRRSQ